MIVSQSLASENKMVFNADETKLTWVSLKKPDVKDQHTIHLPNKLKTESKLSLSSNTKLVTAKSELLHSIELDTNCFLNKAYQDNPGVNKIYKHIRSLKTTYSSLPDEMVREKKKFKGNKELASTFDVFCSQFVIEETQEKCYLSEATYNSLEININEVSEAVSNCSLGTGSDQVPGNNIRAVSNSLNVHFLKLVQHTISASEYRNAGS